MSDDQLTRLIALLEFLIDEHNPAKFGGCCQCDWCKECGELLAILKAELRDRQ